MIPCLSQLTILQQSFADDISEAATVGWPALEVWLTKLEQHLENHTLAETQQLVREHGMQLIAAAGQGGLFVPDLQAQKTHWDHFRRRLELCQALAIPTMIIALDLPDSWTRQQIPQLIQQLSHAAEWAAAFNVQLAIEFQASAPFANCLATAAMLVQTCAHPCLGLCLDLFHFYKGPSKMEDLLLLDSQRLWHVQVCDVAGIPREFWTDADRILPGEGDIPLPLVLEQLQRLGYHGPLSVELANPELWRGPPGQLVQLAHTALSRYLGDSR
jgi:sugar phosphate isomerase/epimerase